MTRQPSNCGRCSTPPPTTTTTSRSRTSLDSGAAASSTLALVPVIASSTWRVEAAPPRCRPPSRSDRDGRVLGVDVSERLLALARAKAEQAGLDNVEFRLGDMRDLELPAASFDAVLLVFGVFFVPDMEALTRELWSLVKPGGRLVITVWARGLMEPAYSTFFEAVGAERPDLVPHGAEVDARGGSGRSASDAGRRRRSRRSARDRRRAGDARAPAPRRVLDDRPGLRNARITRSTPAGRA